MNLQKLFEMQRQLDERIEKEHPRQEGEDRLAKKILALQVELGELANELPEVFKFWSNKKNNYENALKEYVDGLHFILSIGIECNQTDVDSWFVEDNVFVYKSAYGLIQQFDYVFGSIYNFDKWKDDESDDESYEDLFYGYLALGEMLGFTWEQIEEAYMQKNAENHARQERGY
jgi:dimeric dUTPase (all-alpha-NTP-PPase superfamily)